MKFKNLELDDLVHPCVKTRLHSRGGNHGGEGTIKTITPSTGETKESPSSSSSLSSVNKLYTCDVTGTNETLKLSHLTNNV